MQRLFRHICLLGPLSAYALSHQAAQAAVDINIQETGNGVVISAKGSLLLPSTSAGSSTCGNGTLGTQGAIDSGAAALCIGDSSQLAQFFPLVPPVQQSFGSGPLTLATSSSGNFFGIAGTLGIVGSNYTSGSMIHSFSVFPNTTVAALGIASFGDLGVWTVAGTNDTITVRATPGPFAALGLPIAYGASRRMRRRIRSAAK
ncbi:MAG: hypothetical protein RLZZ609_2082 [Cyanobacteriota bacterium]